MSVGYVMVLCLLGLCECQFSISSRERLLLVNPSSSTITKQLVALVVGKLPQLYVVSL